MSTTEEAYTDLFSIARRSRTLSSIAHHLDWDHETYLPFEGQEFRAEQMKILYGMVHEMRSGTAFRSALERLIDIETGSYKMDGLTDRQKAALREWRRDFRRDIALPQEFVEDFAETCTIATGVWREARKNNDFTEFAPLLKKIVDLNRRKADYIGYEKHPYDALLDQYEPEMTTELLDTFFAEVQKDLSPLLQRILDAPEMDNSFLFGGDFPSDKQMAFGNQILSAMGFNWNRGRLDISTHPFCSSPHPTDSRITSRIHPDGLMSYQLSVLHEGGHALYEQNLPLEDYGTPLGDALSLGMHEANSRWWETRIGLTKPFWECFYPEIQKTFPQALSDIPIDRFYHAINKVRPSFIRVEADEVTYPMHIILRFHLEKQLIEGTLEVDLIPAAWEEKMKELLDIVPTNHQEGCLQDIHWSMGAFGYFPTYTLGSMYAASLFTTFEKDHPSWQEGVANGKMLFIKRWLQNHIHQYGREYPSLALIEKVTGKPFSVEPFIEYLNEKYSTIYNL